MNLEVIHAITSGVTLLLVLKILINDLSHIRKVLEQHLRDHATRAFNDER